MEPGGISWNLSCTGAFQNFLALFGTFYAGPRVYINPFLLFALFFSFFFFPYPLSCNYNLEPSLAKSILLFFCYFKVLEPSLD